MILYNNNKIYIYIYIYINNYFLNKKYIFFYYVIAIGKKYTSNAFPRTV